jgi:SAM-dependent methyltransferase
VPFYRDQVVPRLVLLTCGTSALGPLRARTAEGLSGTVLELGFGSGLNLPHYPDAVTRVLAVEPSATAWRLAGRRIAASRAGVVQVGLDGASVPLDDASCDAALCTFTLCTVPEVEAAMAEVRRIVRPGGRFHLLEHGLAPDAPVARRQRRFEPVQRALADGCHLTRDPVAIVEAAGFEVVELDQFYGALPKPWGYLTRASAVRPAA